MAELFAKTDSEGFFPGDSYEPTDFLAGKGLDDSQPQKDGNTLLENTSENTQHLHWTNAKTKHMGKICAAGICLAPWRSSILVLLLALIPCKSVHVVASCARESGSRIEAWSSCAMQLIGEDWGRTRRRTNAPTNAPTDAKQGDGYSPPAKPDFQPNISSSVLDVLNNPTFGQAYDTFVSAKHSDLRDRKQVQVAGVEGFCYDEAFSSKHCGQPMKTSHRRRAWGHRAYNFVCSAENQIAWNHPDQKLYAHGNMGKECDGDPSFCKASICARYEDKNETRKVQAFSVNTGQDLEFPKGKWLSDASKQASLHFTVTCGV